MTREQKEIQRVDAAGHRRRLLGKERSAGPHDQALSQGSSVPGSALSRALAAHHDDDERAERETVATPREPDARMITKP